MKKIKKIMLNKQVVLSLLVMVVIITGTVNWAVNNGSSEESLPAQGSAFVVGQPVESPGNLNEETREKEDARYQAEEDLEKIINNPNTTQNAKDEAATALATLSQKAQEELAAEGQIKAKGFEDAVVYITNSGASVVVSGKELSAQASAQIRDIVMTVANLDATSVKISAK